MFLLSRPSIDKVQELFESQRGGGLTYSPSGCTLADECPSGFRRAVSNSFLGQGEETFIQAVSALQSWQHFSLNWVNAFPECREIIEGKMVVVQASHFGFWSLHCCRIVSVCHEHSPEGQRYGFAYGTLADHAERGEEFFSVRWDYKTDSVSYKILAFSQPKAVAALGYPVTRRLQDKFAVDSHAAMKKAMALPG